MFNFFRNHTKEEVKNDYIASISYKMQADGQTIIDMQIEDYDQKSMIALFSIIEILSDDRCVLETISTLKDNLIKNNKTEWLETLATHTAKVMLKKTNVTKIYEDMINSQPCIKPSEILK